MLNNDFSPLELPQVLSSEMIFEESMIKVRKDLLKLKDQSPYAYYTLVTKPKSVIIIATTQDGKFILNQEYRHPTGKVILCFPGGYIDDGEDPLQAARRELLEETGYEAKLFTIIGSAYPYAGVSGQQVVYVKADQASFKTAPQPETSEIFRTLILPLDELVHTIHQNVPLDGTLCTGLFLHHCLSSHSKG